MLLHLLGHGIDHVAQVLPAVLGGEVGNCSVAGKDSILRLAGQRLSTTGALDICGSNVDWQAEHELGAAWTIGLLRTKDLPFAMILGDSEWIVLNDLPRSIPATTADLPVVGDNLKDAIRAYEKGHIENVLKRTENDKRKAADLLGLSLSSLYRKIDELTITVD